MDIDIEEIRRLAKKQWPNISEVTRIVQVTDRESTWHYRSYQRLDPDLEVEHIKYENVDLQRMWGQPRW